MKKLELNLGYGVQFEGDYNRNGSPRNIAKVCSRVDVQGNDDGFSERVDIMREMVDLWNAKYTGPHPLHRRRSQ